MLRELENSRQLAECREYVVGFCDSLSVLRTAFPGKPLYKLGVLYREIFHKNFNDHNALDDVQALAETSLETPKLRRLLYQLILLP